MNEAASQDTEDDTDDCEQDEEASDSGEGDNDAEGEDEGAAGRKRTWAEMLCDGTVEQAHSVHTCG